jgi:hypothetical protein
MVNAMQRLWAGLKAFRREGETGKDAETGTSFE